MADDGPLLDDMVSALQAFADFADPQRRVPARMPITSGSMFGKRQLMMGDCYRAADAIAALRKRQREAV